MKRSLRSPCRQALAVALGAVLAAGLVTAGASALAAARVTHGNYRGNARPAHAVMATHQGNYRGPARPSAPATTGRDSNLPG